MASFQERFGENLIHDLKPFKKYALPIQILGWLLTIAIFLIVYYNFFASSQAPVPAQTKLKPTTAPTPTSIYPQIPTPTFIPTIINRNQNQRVFCTQDVKLCKDGSYVSRTGPNCEFAKCPGE